MERVHICPKTIVYHSKRYGKNVTVPEGYKSDGATGGIDICPDAFFVHDWILGNYTGSGPKPQIGRWDNGTKITNFQASTIHSDILMEHGFLPFAMWRWPVTFLLGGSELKRVNGWW